MLTQSLDSPSGLGRYGPLAREMAKLGHKVRLIALHPNWNSLERKQISHQGVDVHYVSQMHVRKKGSHKSYFGPLRLLIVSLLATTRLAYAVYHSKAQVIQLCKPQPFNCLAVQLARRGRLIYCDCDDYEAETNRVTNPWQRYIIKHFEDGVINYATGITTNTQFNLQRYIDLGFPESKIIYIPNGVERSRFSVSLAKDRLYQKLNIAPDTPVIAYIGTLGLLSHPVNLLIEAFSHHIIQKIPEARLLLVGGGEDYHLLQKQVKALGINDHTIFTGTVDSSHVPSYFSLATVTVDPVYDNLIARARSPLKVLESLVMGVPVVTSDVGDRRKLLQDGRYGKLVPAGDSRALADGLLNILQNAETRRAMSLAAVADRSQWFWDKRIEDFLKVYQV